MQDLWIFNVAFRWIHLTAAVVLVGGVLYARYIQWPAADSTLTPPQQQDQQIQINNRWRVAVAVASAFLVASGFYQVMAIALPKAGGLPAYQFLLGGKIVIALVLFFLVGVTAGRSSALAAMRQRVHLWLSLAGGLGLLILLISAVLRYLPITVP